MGLIDNIKRSIRGLFKSKNSSLIFSYGNPEVYASVDTEKAISEGYLGNTAVYAIANKYADKFASVPRFVYSGKNTKAFNEGDVVENDLSILINRPNEYQGQDAFLATVALYRLITGEAFIWLNRGDTGQVGVDGGIVDIDDDAQRKKPVLEMYVLPSDHVIVKPDKSNVWGVIGYELEVNGRKLPLRKTDVIHWKNSNLCFDASGRDHLRGRSPLSSGYKTLQQHNDATNSTVRMYQNDGAKGILFNESLNDLDETQQQQVDGVVSRKINNHDIKGSVAALQGKWGYVDIGRSVDMDLLAGKEMAWKELCFLLKTPYELFNTDTTFANKEQAQKGWVSNTILPDCKQFDDELNRFLPIAFGFNGYIASDASELPEMQQDLATLVTALAGAWWLTPNEKRLMTNEEPLGKEFDEPFIPTGIIPLSESGEDREAQRLIDDGLA